MECCCSLPPLIHPHVTPVLGSSLFVMQPVVLQVRMVVEVEVRVKHRGVVILTYLGKEAVIPMSTLCNKY